MEDAIQIHAMAWSEENVDGAVVVRLKGDIDLARSPEIRQRLQSKVNERTANLLLDFSEVNYIDSSGLATLVEYYKNSRPYQGRIALACLSPRVRGVFDLVRLGEIFAIYESVEAAKKEMSDPN